MHPAIQSDWREPLEAAHALRDEPSLVLLYSSLPSQGSGRYSLLAWGERERIVTSRWSTIEARLTSDRQWHENAWFGWLGYGLRHDSEKLGAGAPSPITLPDACLLRFAHLLRFDHETRRVEYYHEEDTEAGWSASQPLPSCGEASVATLASPMAKSEYLASIEATLAQIAAGNFYQANITRKFTGSFSAPADTLGLFARLCAISPSPYSAYMRLDGAAVLSSSPESFLSIDAAGHMASRPIKGSAPRGATPEADAALREALRSSAKDAAENRMITDLVRNDMARVSLPGSVQVDQAMELHSFATVHHLISTIRAQKSPQFSTLAAVEACFPPGSMTGAPKIAAMEWCNRQERLERGVYSGALGWFGGDGSCDLSVVIRTLLIADGKFEFQVGGGIVADSTPENEWRETLTKARAITALLRISEAQLAAL